VGNELRATAGAALRPRQQPFDRVEPGPQGLLPDPHAVKRDQGPDRRGVGTSQNPLNIRITNSSGMPSCMALLLDGHQARDSCECGWRPIYRTAAPAAPPMPHRPGRLGQEAGVAV
jgi:hypothetical protein